MLIIIIKFHMKIHSFNYTTFVSLFRANVHVNMYDNSLRHYLTPFTITAITFTILNQISSTSRESGRSAF